MGLFGKIKSAANKVKDVASDVYDAAADKLDNASDEVRGAVTSAWDKVADASDEAKSAIGDALTHTFALGLDPLVIPPVLGYWGELATQAKGKERGVPMPFRALLQPYFSINLNDIRYAERIRTVGDNAVTFANFIYFPRGVDFDTLEDIGWLVHELRHAEQYQSLGGVVPFLHHYVAEIARALATKGTFRIHDLLELEKDADEHKRAIADLVYWKSRSGTFGVFDAQYYLSRYADLRMTFGNNIGQARNHWAQYGIVEGRASSPSFDVQQYLQTYADLKTAFGVNYNAAIDHWIHFGKAEGRSATSASQTSSPTRLPPRFVHPGLDMLRASESPRLVVGQAAPAIMRGG